MISYSTWHRSLANYSFIFLVVMAFMLPITESGTDIAYILAGFCAVLSGAFWSERSFLIKNPISVYCFVLLVMMLLGLTYVVGLNIGDLKILLRQYSWILLTPLILVAVKSSSNKSMLLNAFLLANFIILMLSFGKLLGFWHMGDRWQPGVMWRGHISQSFFMSFASAMWLYFACINPKFRKLMLVLFVLSAVNIFLTPSRTGYLNWILLVLFVLYRQFSFKILLSYFLLVVAFIAVLFFTSSAFQGRVHEAFHQEEQTRVGQTPRATSIGIRMAQIEGSLKLAKQRPIFGFGTGGLNSAYKSLADNTANYRYVKNDKVRTDITYSNILVEHGIVGLLIVLGFILTLWFYGYKLKNHWPVVAHCFVISFFVAAMFTAFFVSGFATHFLSLMLIMLYSDTSYGYLSRYS